MPGPKLTSALAGFASILCFSCGSKDSPSETSDNTELIRGRWKSSCQEFSSTDPVYNTAKSMTLQHSFNQKDGWVLREYFADTECKISTFQDLYAGTYSLGQLEKSGAAFAFPVNYVFESISVTLNDEASVQYVNNSAFCGGGYTIGKTKHSTLTECDVSKLPWTPSAFTILRLEGKSILPGKVTKELPGNSAETRPKEFAENFTLVRQ